MENDRPDRHGFDLRYAEGLAVLTVHPAAEGRRPVYADDVMARMKILDIPPVPAKRVREIVDAAEGIPRPLVEWPAGAALNARVSIVVDDDRMTARAVTEAAHPGGAPLDARDVKDALAGAGVARGLDQKALQSLLKPSNAGTSVVIARGRDPRPGRPARTECLFVTDRGKPWKDAGGGRIDLKELNFIQNRKAGDLVARRVEAVPPVDGYDVLGESIPADRPPDEPPLKAGPGIRESEDGWEAEIDGNVRLEGDEIIIEPSVSVKNVDYSTGNIDFDGSVVVEGTVADGFSVRAQGDLQVGKTAGRARLESGRNLVLAAGLVGDGEGTCIVGGCLYAKFLEGAVVRAAGDIIVTEAVLHSEVESDGELFLTEGRGEITGGLAVIGKSVDCKKIGNIYAGETRIHVGCPPANLREYHMLAGELKALREETDDMDRQLDYLRSKGGVAPNELSARERARDARIEQLKEGAGRLKSMRGALEPAEGTAIVARDRVFPGAGLFFGLEEYPLGDKGLERAVLRRERGRTVMHGFVEHRGS